MRIVALRDQIWTHLIGKSSELILETRIFHAVCIVAWIALAYNVPLNLYIGLPIAAAVTFVLLLSVSLFYYLSRFKALHSESILGFAIIGNLLFIAIYFFNAGINGPTTLLFSSFFCLLMAIVPKRKNWLWLIVNIITVLALHYLQFFYPSIFQQIYPTILTRYTDMSSAYMIVIILIYLTIMFLRKSYDEEKEASLKYTMAIKFKNDELEASNAEKNKLFSIIAHDLRAPLSSVQGYLELLTIHNLEESDKTELQARLLLLTRNTNNMISNLLSWTRSQMGGVKVRKENISLLKTLTPILEMEKGIAFDKDIRLSYEIDQHLEAIADPDMLQLVVRNLVNNAIKFSKAHGKIVIKARSENDLCILTVTDYGTGISKNLQRNVFSMSVQSTFGTKSEKGVGLGLLLCKEFIELQGGHISFVSEEGIGTTFFLDLPSVDEKLVMY
jgi:two-component system sensor histidine kinase/response regulator